MYKILVVDDDAEICNAMRLVLNFKGYEVKLLTNANEVGQKISEFKPHLIIMDINLGGADGRDICKDLKTNPALQSIPVILFSAYHLSNQELEAVKADDYIPKPLDSNFLVQTINKQLLVNNIIY